MRIHQKTMIEELVQTLFEAHEEIKKCIEKQEEAVALQLLQQCQEGAIQIGTTIEAAEGENFETVTIIEEYCDLLYKLYKELSEDGNSEEKRHLKHLRKLLITIENSIKHDISAELEVVFLPYKASMWDSLESVWRAAERDENCEAYVIPIPYYDRTSDGALGQMHYEGDQYPADIPVTKYDQYDFERQQPDMIFIHNPYDDVNRVTSVHPYFYSKNLKKFTSKLVYIPYFVWGEISAENQAEVDAMKHFCTTPGVVNADRVIVQSEAMRRVYINVLTEAAGEETKPIWEEKVLGLGSPKLDRVLNTGKEKPEIPREWLDVIEKEDGTRKKIVLYNTSITALLENKEVMIRKMKNVFDRFRSCADEIAFLWRPHPLIPATIESMLPNLWNDYKKLMDDFRKEGWGIYDDTPDVDRAVTLGDMYYGDWSSVIELYKTTENPIMIQNMEVLETFDDLGNPKEYKTLSAEDFVRVEDKLYFVVRDINIIYSLDLETQRIELIGSLPEEELFTVRVGAKIIHYKEELIFLPMSADKIWRYHLNTKEWRSMAIKKFDEEGIQEKGEIFQAVLWENTLFAIGTDYPAIIRIDLETEETTYICRPYLDMRELKKSVGDVYFRSEHVQKNEKLYIASCLGNRVLEFNMETSRYQWIPVGSANNRYSGIAWDGEAYWLSPRHDTPVVRWDGKDEVKEYVLPDDTEGKDYSFLGAVCIGENIVLPAFYAGKTIIMAKDEPGHMQLEEKQYTFYKPYGEGGYIAQDADGTLYIDTSEKGKIDVKCRVTGERLRNFLQNQKLEYQDFYEKEVRYESHVIDAIDLCGLLPKKEFPSETNQSVLCGARIWEAMKDY